MKIILIILFTSLLSTAFPQKRVDIGRGCSYYEKVESKSIYVRNCTNSKILGIVDEIMQALSLKQNFTVYEANVSNAIATLVGDERVIIIDPAFLSQIETLTNDRDVIYLILAHEIGHHLNSHLNPSSAQRPFWNEIEADHFAGSVLQKLGKTMITINNVISLIAPEFSSSDTHPEWQARMKACINGYIQSNFILAKKNDGNLKLDSKELLKANYQLEALLNSYIYYKFPWEKNIKYTVDNFKITKTSESSFYEGRENSAFKTLIKSISIPAIKEVYLRWHDPGEIAFTHDLGLTIETLQNPVVAEQLNPSWYFDNVNTISDDIFLLSNISNYIAKIQSSHQKNGNSFPKKSITLPCSNYKVGKFKYYDQGNSLWKITRGTTYQVESNVDYNVSFTSKIRWLSDCQYEIYDTEVRSLKTNEFLENENQKMLVDIISTQSTYHLIRSTLNGFVQNILVEKQ